jgi:hypothetical protein
MGLRRLSAAWQHALCHRHKQLMLRGSLRLGPAASGGSARWRAHRYASLGRPPKS